jgi:hypothetical protein
MDYCKFIVDTVETAMFGCAGVYVGYEIGLKIKKIRARFKDAAGEVEGHSKNDETTQPNYWVNRLDRVLLPPKEGHRPDSQAKASDGSPETPPSP